MKPQRGPDRPARPARNQPPRNQALLRVGAFLGVPIFFAPSWILIATLITVLYSAIMQSLVPGLSTAAAYGASLGFAAALAVCVLAHELGHTATSLALGRPVRRVVIFLLGGVSEIEGEIDRARDEFLIAVSGPGVSALIAGLAAAAGLFASSGSIAAALLGLLAWSNIAVAAFNLLPGLPLDGGRALRAAVWAMTRSPQAGTQVAAWVGRLIAIGIVAAAALLTRGTWAIESWIVSILLAAFIWQGADRSVQTARIRRRLAGIRVTDLLRPGVTVPAGISLAEAVRQARASAAAGIVIVDRADRPQSIVEEARVRAVPVERQPWTSVSEVARALEPGLVLSTDLTADALLAAVRRTPSSEYLVVGPDGTPAGILTAADLAVALGGGPVTGARAEKRRSGGRSS